MLDAFSSWVAAAQESAQHVIADSAQGIVAAVQGDDATACATGAAATSEKVDALPTAWLERPGAWRAAVHGILTCPAAYVLPPGTVMPALQAVCPFAAAAAAEPSSLSVDDCRYVAALDGVMATRFSIVPSRVSDAASWQHVAWRLAVLRATAGPEEAIAALLATCRTDSPATPTSAGESAAPAIRHAEEDATRAAEVAAAIKAAAAVDAAAFRARADAEAELDKAGRAAELLCGLVARREAPQLVASIGETCEFHLDRVVRIQGELAAAGERHPAAADGAVMEGLAAAKAQLLAVLRDRDAFLDQQEPAAATPAKDDGASPVAGDAAPPVETAATVRASVSATPVEENTNELLAGGGSAASPVVAVAPSAGAEPAAKTSSDESWQQLDAPTLPTSSGGGDAAAVPDTKAFEAQLPWDDEE